jgi:predicted phage terminase large subunit-like protein
LGKDRAGFYYILDVVKLWATPHAVEKEMLRCAAQDGKNTLVAFMQDPGSAGVAEAQSTARALDGYNVRFATATGDKETRCKPISAQAEAGNVKIVRGLWNEDFLRELENFPVGRHDDCVDSLSGAHGVLSQSTDGVLNQKSAEEFVRLNTPLDTDSNCGLRKWQFMRDPHTSGVRIIYS